ncbi:hypothetical protein M758_1G013200 [Ceratodon purpureus]|nr:hypothetical protein M758_1G013200 [Ceratodon purpureus]
MEKVKTFVSNIPWEARPGDLVTFLERHVGEGTISSVEIQYNKNTLRSLGKGIVHFEDQDAAHKAAELAKRETLRFGSRILRLNVHNNHIVLKPKHNLISLKDCTLTMGCMTQEDTMQVLWSSQPNAATEFDFNSKRLRHVLTMETSRGNFEYKLEFHFKDLVSIEGANLPRAGFDAFLLQLRNPPRLYFRKLMDSSTCSEDLTEIFDNYWSYYKGVKEEPWVRTTDFTPDGSIGQSWAYLLRCPSGVSTKTKNEILSKLAGYRLTSYPSTPRRLVLHTEANSNVRSQTLVPIVDAPLGSNISFDAMFLLNLLVQSGYIIPASLTGAFWYLLYATPVEHVKLALREIWSANSMCYDPADWIRRVDQKYRKPGRQIFNAGSIKPAAGLFYVHRLYITPTKVYCHGPEIDMSNRVTRYHADKIDSFLRVSFVDEDWDSISAGALYSGVGKERSPVYDRILSVMREGVMLAGKKYEFLAFSSSQLREQSFWMFASNDDITAHGIRAWMGDFLDIRNVALCAARMGQCFSTSTATLEVHRDEVEDIPDVVRVDPETDIEYNFSDGIGKISKELADKVTRKCGFRRMGVGLTPSAFQIRYGGFKGVVAVDPYSEKKLSLRPSMNKFSSTHIGLEILSWSKYLPCYLNRQVISLLSTLGVPDLVFERMQASVLTQLDAMLDDPVAAIEILQATFSGETHKTATLMLEAGYLPNREPYLKSILEAFRAFQLLNLRTKTKIFVPKGALLMGCLDESAYLNYGEVFLQLTPSSSSGSRQRFNDGLSSFQRYHHGDIMARVVTGTVVIAKNPCVHPGDVRVLKAVDIPSLRHMVNCLVFPQEGHRPHPNECSGSDLDGDLYFVSWDESLIPTSVEDPMDYTPAPKVILDHPVTVEELHEFFVDYIVNDNLGQISNAHVVFCDSEPLKARSPNCIELARLFSVAVDFPKTGVPAIIPYHLRPRDYPDFMEKEDKTTYKSERVIGTLFRSVKEAAKEQFFSLELTRQSMLQNYDLQLQVPGFENYLFDAEYHRHLYDTKLMGLMNQYGIETEAEVMSGNILRLSRHFRKHAGEARQRIRLAVKALIREAQKWFREGIDNENEEDEYYEDDEDYGKDDQFAKASAWYHVTYHPDYLHQDHQYSAVSRTQVYLLSFPWVVCDVLLRIKGSSSMRLRRF